MEGPDGKRGESWYLPHLCSPKLREEKDRAGHACEVVDVVFHSQVIARGEVEGRVGEQWREMVGKTAVEMVSKVRVDSTLRRITLADMKSLTGYNG